MAAHRDPLHWSPATVEFALTGWFVNGVEARPDFLRGFPQTLRRVIPYAHEVRDEHPLGSAYGLDALANLDERPLPEEDFLGTAYPLTCDRG